MAMTLIYLSKNQNLCQERSKVFLFTIEVAVNETKKLHGGQSLNWLRLNTLKSKNERVNVNKLKFENLREMESKLEKAAMNSKTDLTDDENPLLQWYKPRPIKVTNRESFTPGEKSKEKETQSQREKNVLAVIYFSKSMTPETPSE